MPCARGRSEQEGVDDRGRITTWNRFQLGILVSTARATNFVVEGSDLFSQFQVFDSECAGNSYGRISGNVLYDGAEVIRMCGTNQMIFEGNDATNVGDVGGGSDIDNYGGVPSTTNIWHGSNIQRFTWGSDR